MAKFPSRLGVLVGSDPLAIPALTIADGKVLAPVARRTGAERTLVFKRSQRTRDGWVEREAS